MLNHSPNIPVKRGFTIVEVLIVSPIVILMIGIFVAAIVSMTGDVLSSRGAGTMSYSIQDALDRIQSDVRLSGAFLATNNVALSSPQGLNDDRTNFDNANSSASVGSMLILNAYATTNNPLSASRSIMYMSNQPNACNSSQLNQNVPFTYNIVYFVKNNSLWRRVIMPASYSTIGCSGGSIGASWQVPSCSPGYSNSFCKGQDEDLVDNIPTGGFSVSYYSNPGDATANSIASDATKSDTIRQAALQTAGTVGVTISGSTTISGRSVSQSGTIRATSPNNYTDTTADKYWVNASFQNGWTNYGDVFVPGSYRKTKDGIVVLRGLLNNGPYGQTIFTLPVGYRPTNNLIFQPAANNGSWGAGGRLDITTGGQVIAYGGSGWISLDNVRFMAASDAPNPFSNLPYSNGWASYTTLHPSDQTPYGEAAYTIDADGRVLMLGLVSSNSSTSDGQTIVTLPSGAYPSEYHHISVYNCSVFGFIGVSANSTVQSKVSASSTTCLSLVTMFYPSSYTGWLGMVMQNSWVAYSGGYSTPQYTKASDGIVTMHGLIKNGSTTQCNTIFTLPVGYRPSGRLLLGTVAAGTFSRIDIDASGNVMYCSGSNGWLSLDGLSFYADQ